MMGKYLVRSSFVLFILAGVSGCQVGERLTNKQAEIKTFAIDFRKYADEGFLFMPDEYFGEYEVKGIINVEMHPEVRYIEGNVPLGGGYQSTNFFIADKSYSQIVTNMDMDELINHIYNLAIEWGGDAFTHFKSGIEVGRTNENPNSTYLYYTISGIVIKRK